MSKIGFWLTVVGVAIVGILAFKAAAGALPSDGLKKVAAAV